jgi:hypothetical protein
MKKYEYMKEHTFQARDSTNRLPDAPTKQWGGWGSSPPMAAEPMELPLSPPRFFFAMDAPWVEAEAVWRLKKPP